MPTLLHVGLQRGSLYLGLLTVFLCGCTTEVVQERFNPPPDATNKFLGYFTAADKQTTCGNCHVTHQAAWVQTAHASAYDVPATSSNVGPACYTCHTVSARGNSVADPAGWDKVQDAVYHDVQCENCHGPGLDHVMAPDAPKSESNPPLAHIAVPVTDVGPVDSATITNSTSCGSCHNQNSGPGVRAYEEWAASGHARPVVEVVNGVPFSPADVPGCQSCHEAKGILAAWGVTAEYAERGQTGSANNLGQTCAVCHDPHGSAKDPTTGQPLAHQLRFPISTPDVNQQLCMKCHQRRAVPDQASARGPHSPQGPMLLGDAGYQPAGFQPDLQAVASTHGTDRNPELCAGCHVQRLTGTDVTTGKPAVSAGHLFVAIPCLDAGGLPDLAAPDDCEHDVPSRSWAACSASGCHADATTAVSAFTVITQDVDRLTKQIWDDKNANDAIDPDSTACSALALPCANPTGNPATDDANRANWDAGLLARTDLIPGTEYVTNDNKITPAEGARFNVRMLRIEGGADGSHGVHNPFLARALLGADITELQNTYPGLPSVSAAVRSMMEGRLGAMLKRVYHPATVTQTSSR